MSLNFISEIYSQPQTVFTLKDLSLMFRNLPYDNLKRKASYFAKTGKLLKPRAGIYAKENYDVFELGNKIYTPSYISLESVLQKEGVIFQSYSTIFLVSYLSRKIKVGKTEICYKKIPDGILCNLSGIEDKNGCSFAGKERAFLDAVFLYKNYHFDNLAGLNWEKVMEMRGIYKQKILNKRVDQYYKIYKNEVNV